MNPMEQPLEKAMPTQQIPLDLDIPTEAEAVTLEQTALARGEHNPEVRERDPLDLSHEEVAPFLPSLSGQILIDLHKKWVGKDPVARGFTEDEMRENITNPKAALERMAATDAKDDRAQRTLGRGHY